MKQLSTLALLSFAATTLFGAAPLGPAAKATLVEHLTEVNKFWAEARPDGYLLEPAVFEDENQRIQTHLRLVEQALRERELPGLSKEQLEKRRRHLDALRGYWLRGAFPTNHFHPNRQPYFTDNFGVRCAVGELVWQSGEAGLVEKISRDDNYGHLPDLAKKYPEIGRWAAENGFTTAELAWIQPGYPCPKPTYQAWGNGQGTSPGGKVNALAETFNSQSFLVVAGSFSSIDGFAANNIARWNGSYWYKMGSGLDGEVRDLLDTYAGLVAVGQFSIPGQPDQQNAAIWDGNSWKGLQTGDMGGRINSVAIVGSRLFFGGDFSKFNGQPAASLAAGEFGFGGAFTLLDLPAFSVNGPVNFVEEINGHCLVGGDFTETSTLDPVGIHLNNHGLAYFDYSDWITGLADFDKPHPTAAGSYLGYLVVGHAPSDSSSWSQVASILNAGTWADAGCSGLNAPLGFCMADGQLFGYGDFTAGLFFYGTGLARFNEFGGTIGLTLANGAVTAFAYYKNYFYLAGDFTQLHNEPWPGLARVLNSPTAASEPAVGEKIHARFAECQLFVTSPERLEGARCRVFDVSGRAVFDREVELLEGQTALPLPGLGSGVYFFEIRSGRGGAAGRFAVSSDGF